MGNLKVDKWKENDNSLENSQVLSNNEAQVFYNHKCTGGHINEKSHTSSLLIMNYVITENFSSFYKWKFVETIWNSIDVVQGVSCRLRIC